MDGIYGWILVSIAAFGIGFVGAIKLSNSVLEEKCERIGVTMTADKVIRCSVEAK